MKSITYHQIWETLSKINVEEHTEKKGAVGGFQAKYLSWSWAWTTLMENYPQAVFEFTQYELPDGSLTDVLTYADGTCQVECTMWIGDLKRTMWLSVMDHRHNAIPNPSSSQINTAKMRCLTKLIAFWGLGFYIYAGEDLPPSEEPSKKPKSKPKAKAKPKKKPPAKMKVSNGAGQVDERASALLYIEENKMHEVFDEQNKTAIQSFLDDLGEDIDDDKIIVWRDRMKKVINNYNQGA